MDLLVDFGTWIGLVIYVTPVVPVWCFCYLGSRPRRSRLASWALASLMATFWPITLGLAWAGVLMTTTREERHRQRDEWAMGDRIKEIEGEFRTATAGPVA